MCTNFDTERNIEILTKCLIAFDGVIMHFSY